MLSPVVLILYGIGITYGIKATKICFVSKIILFFVSFIITACAVWVGNGIKNMIPESLANHIGSFILILIGTVVLIKSIFEKQAENDYYDFNHSKVIDPKEAFILGIALSLDGFGIGISSSMLGVNSVFFAILVAIFQLLFLSVGNFFGIKINQMSKIPNQIWTIISGLILVNIGIFQIF